MDGEDWEAVASAVMSEGSDGAAGEVFFRGPGPDPGDPWAYQQYDVLYCVVIEEGRGRKEAAEAFGCSPETLDVWVRKLGLDDHPDLYGGDG